MRRLPFILFAVLPGLIGLGVGGYFVVTNVIETRAALTVGAGRDACTVLTAASSQQLLGPSAQPPGKRNGPGYSYCTYTASGGRFISLEVGSHDLISPEAPSSARATWASVPARGWSIRLPEPTT